MLCSLLFPESFSSNISEHKVPIFITHSYLFCYSEQWLANPRCLLKIYQMNGLGKLTQCTQCLTVLFRMKRILGGLTPRIFLIERDCTESVAKLLEGSIFINFKVQHSASNWLALCPFPKGVLEIVFVTVLVGGGLLILIILTMVYGLKKPKWVYRPQWFHFLSQEQKGEGCVLDKDFLPRRLHCTFVKADPVIDPKSSRLFRILIK